MQVHLGQGWHGSAWAKLRVGAVGKQQGPQVKHHRAENGLDSAGDRNNFMSQISQYHAYLAAKFTLLTNKLHFKLPFSNRKAATEQQEKSEEQEENSLGSLYRAGV